MISSMNQPRFVLLGPLAIWLVVDIQKIHLWATWALTSRERIGLRALIGIMLLVAFWIVVLVQWRRDRAALDVCGFEYCLIRTAIIDAGLGDVMTRLAETSLNDEEARELAGRLISELGEDPVELVVVDFPEGKSRGQLDFKRRTILIERPVATWTLIHAVAHLPLPGRPSGWQWRSLTADARLDHGEQFQQTLIRLTRIMDTRLD
jgi:hypothetical protein